MKRGLTVFLMLALLWVLPAYAQDDDGTPAAAEATPAASVSMDDINALATDVARLAESAQLTTEASAASLEFSNGLLNLFQSVGGALSIIITMVAIIGTAAGYAGLNSLNNRLNNAESLVAEKTKTSQVQLDDALKQLNEARTNLENALERRQTELESVRTQLEHSLERAGRSLDELNSKADKATLALSLLPLGERQYQAQDLNGALDTYRSALALDEDNMVIHYRLGYVYTQNGDLENAQKHLRAALDIDPNFAPALAGLGYVYRRIGEKMQEGLDRDALLVEAEANLIRALKISPKLVDDDKESWWGSLGGLYKRRGQINDAIRAYREASKVTPNSSYPFSNLALLYMQQRNRDQMLEYYAQTERLARREVLADTDNYWAYNDLITARLALGHEEEANELIPTVLKADSPYLVESLQGTLRQLAEVLLPEEVPPIERFLEKLQTRLTARKTDEDAKNGASPAA